MADEKTVITLICERAADVNDILDKSGNVQAVPGLKAIKLPCSGMIQPLMIEAALKAGASGVIVCGCQIGDCYYREGNRMIRERLLGERPPNLKKSVDRRRVTALWLSRLQRGRFESEAKEFVAYVKGLDAGVGGPDDKPAAKPAASPAETKAAPKPAEAKNEPKPAEDKGGKPESKADESKVTASETPDTKTDEASKPESTKPADGSAEEKKGD